MPPESLNAQNAIKKSSEETFAGVTGHLFVPNSFLEYYSVHVNIITASGSFQYLIGLSDAAEEGRWVVSDGPQKGDDVNAELSWQPGEPDGGTGQNCAIHNPNWGWIADVSCSTYKCRYVIEFECPFGQRFNDQGSACVGA